MIEGIELPDTLKWRKAIRHPHGPKKAVMRHTLLTLSTWANSRGESMFPSIETLSIATGLNRETVRRALQEAWETGWVIRYVRRQSARGRPLSYEYAASTPDGWDWLEDIDHAWELDPEWRSERTHRQRERASRLQCPQPEKGPVPTVDRDVSEKAAPPNARARDGANVPVLGGGVPVVRGGVPYQDSMKRSSNSSWKSSSEENREGLLAQTPSTKTVIQGREKPRSQR